MTFSEATPSKQTQAYFPALTGIRWVAALLVYAHHMRPAPGILPDFIQKFLTAGHIGVTIFFVLSGFLIAYRYEAVLQNKNVAFGSYIFRRVARIFPLYLALTIIVLIWQKDSSVWHWFLNLTLLKGFFDIEKFTGIAQGWSLTVEESFYLAAPLLFYVFRKMGVGAVPIILIFGISLVYLSQVAGFSSFMHTLDFMAEFTLFGRIFEFFCGYKLAQYYKNFNGSSSSGSFYSIMGSVLFLAGYAAVAFSPEFIFTFPVPFKPETVTNNFILPIGIAVLFYGLLTESTFIRKALSLQPVQLLGKSSYAFYLIHAGVFYKFIYFNISNNKIVSFLIVGLSAVAIYRFFEEPVNHYLRRKIDAWELRNKMKLKSSFSEQKS